MTSNSGKQTLEERLVETIKDTTLFNLVKDEDAITDLVTRAIKEALFQPKRISTGYGNHKEEDSPLVAATRKIAEDYAKQMVQKIVDQLLADPENIKKIRDAILILLPSAISGSLTYSLEQMKINALNSVEDLIMTMKFKNKI
jgi:hypothetical protein